MKQIKITQSKGTVRCTESQKATLKILKLGRVGRSITLEAKPEVLGQIRTISHLVKVETL